MTKLANLGLLLLVACGGAPSTTATTPAPTPAAPSTAAPAADNVLRLAKAELEVVEDERYIYILAADGLFSAMGDDLGFLTVPVARVSADGVLRKLDGTLAATLGKDGALTVDGKPTGVTIDLDGVVTAKGETMIALGPDGAASGPLANKAAFSYQGDADARRAMLFAMLTSMSMIATVDDTATAPASTTIPACDAYRATAAKAQACPGFDKSWASRLAKGVARVNRFATTAPVEGTEAAARSCVRATERIKKVLATPACSL